MPKKNTTIKISNKTIKHITDLMLDKKALDVTIVDISKITALTDYFIICTSDSDPQTRAIYNHVKDELSKKNIKAWKTEGYEHLNWVIMDYVDFVIHIFNKETRAYYNFERLWADAKITKISNS